MKKNLYSLTLSDEVVREVDALAHRLGTNRSALVNRILSEYVLARAGAVFRTELAVHVAQIEPRLQVPSDGQV